MRFKKLIICITATLAIAALILGSANAQDATAIESKSTQSKDDYSLEDDIAEHPLKAPDTSSPHATLKSFLESVNRAYRILMVAHKKNVEAPGLLNTKSAEKLTQQAKRLFERGVYCLNLRKIPEALRQDVGYESAIMLKEIFDRIELPPSHLIPDAKAIEEEQEQKKFPKLDRWRIPDTDIVIARVEDGPRKGQYLFTPLTVAHLKKFYEKVKDLPYKSDAFITRDFLDFYNSTPGQLLPPKWSQWLPGWLTERFFSQSLWQWCALSVWSCFALVFIKLIYRWLRPRDAMLSKKKRYGRIGFFFLIIAGTTVISFFILTEQINLTGSVLKVVVIILQTVLWLSLAIAIYYSGQVVGEVIALSPKIDPEGIRASYIRALFGVLGFIAMAAIFIFGLSRVGVSLVPILTGVGIGGLAIALAARPTLENIIGSFMIFLDKPFRVGQRVNVMGQNGTVESVGLRSTKIRLGTGHQTSIPNEKMTATEIENIARRPYIRRVFNITITYDTPPEKINRAVEILREILSIPEAPETEPILITGSMESNSETTAHPNEAINQEDFPPRVYFNEFNNDSLNILVIYWYHPAEYWNYLEHANWVNIKIMERFKAEGIDFAYPTQTLHLAGDNKRPLTFDQREVA